MTHALRSAAVASLAALAALAAIIAADLTPPAQAQSEDETTGRIVARRLANGRVEFAWQTPSGARVEPRHRYFPADAEIGKWLRSSPVEVGGVELGRINARLRSDGRIEFAFTPTDGERILPPARHFPADARVGRWLRSTEIAISPPAPRYIAVSAGAYHTCAIRESGEVACWGDDRYRQSDAPAGSYSAVSAGSYHTCGLRESGAIECWGNNEFGQNDAPAGSYSAISGGGWHTCGLHTDGKIACWGWWRTRGFPTGRYTVVSAAWGITCAIRESGEIVCRGWDENDYPNAPAGRFTTVSVGHYDYNCAIGGNREIVCWGWNVNDQPNAPAGRFTNISAGSEHTCAIRESDSAIECWGRNDDGQTDVPTN